MGLLNIYNQIIVAFIAVEKLTSINDKLDNINNDL